MSHSALSHSPRRPIDTRISGGIKDRPMVAARHRSNEQTVRENLLGVPSLPFTRPRPSPKLARGRSLTGALLSANGSARDGSSSQSTQAPSSSSSPVSARGRQAQQRWRPAGRGYRSCQRNSVSPAPSPRRSKCTWRPGDVVMSRKPRPVTCSRAPRNMLAEEEFVEGGIEIPVEGPGEC